MPISRRNAIIKINEQYGKYLPNLLTEESTLTEIKDAQKLVNDQLLKNVAIKAKATELNAVFLKQISLEKDLHKLTARLQQTNTEAALKAESQLKEVAKSMANLGQTSNAEITQMGENLARMFGINRGGASAVSDLLGQYVKLYQEVNTGTKSIDEFYNQLLKGIADVEEKEISGGKDIEEKVDKKKEKTQDRELEKRAEYKTLQKQITEETKGTVVAQSNVLSGVNESIDAAKKLRGLSQEQKDDLERIAGYIFVGADALNQMGDAIGDVNEDLGKTINIVADIAKDIGGIAQGIASGDYLQAAVAGVNLVTKLFTIRKRKAEEAQKAEEEALERQKELFAQITTTTSESITDSILEGFKNGKFAAEDFANDFESLMKNAMLETFKVQFLQKQFDEFYKAFGDAAESDGALSESEIADLKEQFNANIVNAQEGFDAFNEMFEGVFGEGATTSGNTEQGMAGEIRASLTEETGT